jgi:predicted CXXCH cytochrome family protein
MRTLGTAALVLTLVTPAVAADSCMDCHRDLGDELGAPVEAMQNDVHTAAGLSCADCHGGDPGDPEATSMDQEKGFAGSPEVQQIPTFCGRCHADESYMRRYDPQLPTDQLAEYHTSVHGLRLNDGDTQVATCVSCHGTHGILPASDARSPIYPVNVAKTCARCHADASYMQVYRIPVDQLVEYQRSVHGTSLLAMRDLSAPTCNDCHGNHGAYPPGTDSVAAVCGQCHVANKELFLASPHHAAFTDRGLPECITCHGNHDVVRTSDEMVGTSKAALCIGCHAAGSAGHAAAGRMRAVVDELRDAIELAAAALARASAAGMEMSEHEFALQAAREALVHTRNQVHAADPSSLETAAAPGLEAARGVASAAAAALVEFRNRRWMALIPLGMIALVGVLLYRKIRSLDEHDRRT